MTDRLLQLYLTLSAPARDRERGQTVIEYALILAFVAAIAVALGTSSTIRNGVGNAFSAIGNLFP